MFNFFSKTTNKNRRIIIGDIHGHYDGLIALLEKVTLGSDDQVYFLGDLIDRGPKSAQVVKFLRDNNYPCLLGNHEVMLLRAVSEADQDDRVLKFWIQAGGDATLDSYGTAGILKSDLDWMASLPTYLDLGDVWLVHAGVDPYLRLDQQGEQQFCWMREKFFSSAFPYFENKLIITGHTITFTLPGVSPGELAAGVGWLNIETGAYHRKSGWMTALDIDNKMVHQYNVFSKKYRYKKLEQITKQIDPSRVTAYN
jgi:serine/threonine protein phosphatase 1